MNRPICISIFLVTVNSLIEKNDKLFNV